jgi:hypothetical protein
LTGVQWLIMTSLGRQRGITGKAEFGLLLHQFVERKIELLAYERYEQRGRVDGQAIDDWLRAEAEVLQTTILSPLLGKS